MRTVATLLASTFMTVTLLGAGTVIAHATAGAATPAHAQVLAEKWP